MRPSDLALTPTQDAVAREAIVAMSTRLPATRVEAICSALARGEVLIDYDDQGRPVGCVIVDDTRLTRQDLVEAAALELRLRAALGESGAEQTIAILGRRGVVLGLLISSAVARLQGRKEGRPQYVH